MGGGGGGGGGDGGLEYMQAKDAEEKARKKAAISKINRIFGLPGDKGPAPQRGDFYTQGGSGFSALPTFSKPNRTFGLPGDKGPTPQMGAFYTQGGLDFSAQPTFIDAVSGLVEYPSLPGFYDDAGYEQALARYNAIDEETLKNKAAREADYSRVGSDVKSFHMDRLSKDLEKVVRQMKFHLLGSGNWGGSGELDERANLDETRNRGVMDIQNLADNTSDSVRAADTDKMTSLIAAINAGMEESDAANAAAAHTSTAAQRAIQSAKGASFANLFDDLMGSYAMRAANHGTGRTNDFYAQRQLASVPGSSGGSYSGAYSRS